LVSDIPAGDGKIANLFYSVCTLYNALQEKWNLYSIDIFLAREIYLENYEDSLKPILFDNSPTSLFPRKYSLGFYILAHHGFLCILLNI
jgi:hypothetical protein